MWRRLDCKNSREKVQNHMISTLFRCGAKVYFLSCIIFISVSFESTLAKEHQKEKVDLRSLEKDWTKCCNTKGSFCSSNNCYFAQWRRKTWSSSRSYCRSFYPDLPDFLDLVQFENEREIQNVVQQLIADPKAEYYYPKRYSETKFWTSGLRCPGGGNSLSRWTSNETFPEWLISKKELKNSISNQKDCQFLIIFLKDNRSDLLKYQFQKGNQELVSICQFRFPGDVSIPTTEDATTKEETLRTKQQMTTTTDVKVASTSKTTPYKTTLTTKTSTEKKTTLISSSSSVDRPLPTARPVTRLEGLSCKSQRFEGIDFPLTPPGLTVNVNCSKGMTGYAWWTCDPKTSNFFPDRPNTEQCKHKWILDLENEVDTGKDAVTLSQKLANSTKHSSLAHGDISAIVNVTGKLLELYAEQRKMNEVIDMQDEIQPSYVFAKSVAVTYSYVLGTEVKKAWTDQDKTYRRRVASKILSQMSTTGHHLSCSKVTETIEDLQFSLKEENIHLQTFLIDSKSRTPGPYVFPKPINGKKLNTDSHLTFPGNLNFSLWPTKSHCGSKRTAVGILYRNIGQFLMGDDAADGTSNNSEMAATPIMSFSLSDDDVHSVRLPQDSFVQIELSHVVPGSETTHRTLRISKARCVFWNFTKGKFGQWDTSGCHMVSSNATHTNCACDHLTNFAVIMDVSGIIVSDDPILTFLTYICCGTSTIALLATCLCLIFIRAFHCRRSTITCNLSICLLAANLFILFGLDQTDIPKLCVSVAVLLHYFLLSAFCWMLLQACHLYQMVVLVFSRSSRIPIYYFFLFGYGTPAVIVGTSVALRLEDYGVGETCWLTNNRGLIWSFIGPACVILTVNFVVFVLTMKSASTVKIKKEMTASANIKAWIKGSFSVMCVLGLTWFVGFFYMSQSLSFFAYIFTVLNGLQGVFIFLFHILLNEKTTNFFMKAIHRKIKPKARVRKHTSSSDVNHRSNKSRTTSTTTSGGNDSNRSRTRNS